MDSHRQNRPDRQWQFLGRHSRLLTNRRAPTPSLSSTTRSGDAATIGTAAICVNGEPIGASWPKRCFFRTTRARLPEIPTCVKRLEFSNVGVCGAGCLRQEVSYRDYASRSGSSPPAPRTTRTCLLSGSRRSPNATSARRRRMFWAMMGAVGFILLIACANVANLLFGSRTRDSVFRTARADACGSCCSKTWTQRRPGTLPQRRGINAFDLADHPWRPGTDGR